MKTQSITLALVLAIVAASPIALAQGGSGTPSAEGQSESKTGAASADRAVEARHEKVLARSRARQAKRASKAASAASSQ